jgi:nitroimidazol reductase NimA-like FMN-containing flavoprotein (pyridoxamine 5'-phosphate oxidase superfamily)
MAWPTGWKVEEGFDLDGFLAQPLVARIASNGPVVAPVWFLWEDNCFWWLTGSWSKLAQRLAKDSRIAIVVDINDLATGEVKKVYATGRATIVPLDADRTYRKLSKYLGGDKTKWDPRFGTDGTENDPSGAMVRMQPERLIASDASYTVSP